MRTVLQSVTDVYMYELTRVELDAPPHFMAGHENDLPVT